MTFLENAPSDKVERALAVGQSIGRPLVSDEALSALEHQLGRALKPRKRGRPKRQVAAGTQGDIFTSE